MRSNTQVLSSGTFYIEKNMAVMAFSVVGLTSGSSFSYQGGAPINDKNGTPLTPTPITVSGQQAYNSRWAQSPNNPWDLVTITVISGSIGIELFQ